MIREGKKGGSGKEEVISRRHDVSQKKRGADFYPAGKSTD